MIAGWSKSGDKYSGSRDLAKQGDDDEYGFARGSWTRGLEDAIANRDSSHSEPPTRHPRGISANASHEISSLHRRSDFAETNKQASGLIVRVPDMGSDDGLLRRRS